MVGKSPRPGVVPVQAMAELHGAEINGGVILITYVRPGMILQVWFQALKSKSLRLWKN